MPKINKELLIEIGAFTGRVHDALDEIYSCKAIKYLSEEDQQSLVESILYVAVRAYKPISESKED